ncbi:MAG: hypothetical protein HYZ20_13730 [Burkholderiales bacterium]|nr:hypothetical protein [Burkholderiales bacterium]
MADRSRLAHSGVRLAALSAAVAVSLAAATAAQAADTLGQIGFPRGDQVWGGFATGTRGDGRFFSVLVDGHPTCQAGELDIDIAAGTVRGVDSAEQLVGLNAQTTATAWASPEVQVVALPGSVPAASVPLDLRVTLDGCFEVCIFTGMTSSVTNPFTATPDLHFPGVTATRAEATYGYDRLLTFTGDEARHQGFTAAQACAGCFAEVLVQDPLNEYDSGCHDITLRTTIDLEPGAPIVAELFISGRNIVGSHGGYGD